MKLSHKKFIKTSIPFTLATMAASLMGAVDTAVVGHLGNYTYINAVSLGAVIFSTVMKQSCYFSLFHEIRVFSIRIVSHCH